VACVYTRGTKRKPLWWIKYRDLDGKWRAAPSRQATKQAAEEVWNVVEHDIEPLRVAIAAIVAERHTKA
jgi:hypothetical protein